jgi:hypothetical protein
MVRAGEVDVEVGSETKVHSRRVLVGWLAVCSVTLSVTVAAPAVAFNNVVALGDSLFDDEGGTRSPVAAEHVADAIGVPITNLARSGADSGDLLAQGQHTSAAAQFGSGDLALVWIGGNDFLGNAPQVAAGQFGFLDELESNVDTAVSTLRGAGMEVVAFNLLDMALLPAILDIGIGLPNFRAASQQWQSRLDVVATSRGAHVVDVFTLFDQLVADPEAFSLLGNSPVLGPSVDCDFCVFADSIHPSSLAQGFVTNATIGVLNDTYDPFSLMPLETLSQVELATLAGLLPGDFNTDGSIDGIDADALVVQIAAMSDDAAFDLTGDGGVDLADLGEWLAVAGAADLPGGGSYLFGDANLDGSVDGDDFSLWNQNKFTQLAAWTSGDFNADGLVDGQDLFLWNQNKFTSSNITAVPEASTRLLVLLACAGFICWWRWSTA